MLDALTIDSRTTPFNLKSDDKQTLKCLLQSPQGVLSTLMKFHNYL